MSACISPSLSLRIRISQRSVGNSHRTHRSSHANGTTRNTCQICCPISATMRPPTSCIWTAMARASKNRKKSKKKLPKRTTNQWASSIPKLKTSLRQESTVAASAMTGAFAKAYQNALWFSPRSQNLSNCSNTGSPLPTKTWSSMTSSCTLNLTPCSNSKGSSTTKSSHWTWGSPRRRLFDYI